MKWITRERPKIDRIACPWLIRRFIDPVAEIIYVPEQDVLTKAAELEATAFDVPIPSSLIMVRIARLTIS